MNVLIGVLIGMVVGAFLAVMVMALCITASERDKLDDLYYSNLPDTEHSNKCEHGRRCE